MVAIKFANLEFDGLTMEKVLSPKDSMRIVVTANAEIIVKANEDKDFGNILKTSTKTFDGRIPHLIASFLNKGRKIDKISGSDFIYEIAQLAKINSERIFLLGALEDVNEKASEKLREKYGISVAGFSPAFSNSSIDEKQNLLILKRIELFKPQYIFVALGSGKQEKWLFDNKDYLSKIGIKIGVGCGGTLDFVAGRNKRAPVWVQKIGMEGVFRFLIEPKWYRFKRILTSFRLFKYI